MYSKRWAELGCHYFRVSPCAVREDKGRSQSIPKSSTDTGTQPQPPTTRHLLPPAHGSGAHQRRAMLWPPSSSSEDPPGSRVPGATPLETTFASPSAAGLQGPARFPRLLLGESADGLASGRPRARRRRRAPERGEGGRVAGVGDSRRGATSRTCTRGAPGAHATAGDLVSGAPASASTTAGGGGCSGASWTAKSYRCRGHTTQPCTGHQNGGGKTASAGSMFSSAWGGAGGCTGWRGTRGCTAWFDGPASFRWRRRTWRVQPPCLKRRRSRVWRWNRRSPPAPQPRWRATKRRPRPSARRR